MSGLGDARREALAEALDDHRRGDSQRDCIEGVGWAWACWCDCGWHGRDRDHQAHQAADLAPLVAGWIAEERAGAWDEGFSFAHWLERGRSVEDASKPGVPDHLHVELGLQEPTEWDTEDGPFVPWNPYRGGDA